MLSSGQEYPMAPVRQTHAVSGGFPRISARTPVAFLALQRKASGAVCRSPQAFDPFDPAQRTDRPALMGFLDALVAVKVPADHPVMAFSSHPTRGWRPLRPARTIPGKVAPIASDALPRALHAKGQNTGPPHALASLFQPCIRQAPFPCSGKITALLERDARGPENRPAGMVCPLDRSMHVVPKPFHYMNV